VTVVSEVVFDAVVLFLPGAFFDATAADSLALAVRPGAEDFALEAEGLLGTLEVAFVFDAFLGAEGVEVRAITSRKGVG
jgi:hypothetical protein